jgi:[protein-PII] uridylyltransferase
VLAARAWTQPGAEGRPGEWACSVWEVGDPSLEAAVLLERIRRVSSGATPVRRPSPGRPARATLPPVVEVHPDASRGATVLEVRMEDRPGVLHRVLRVLAGLELTVASAHLSTLGPQAVDVFYVQEQGGVRLGDERAATAAHAVRQALEE